jgi:TP901 family phage tail tape measure protein
MTGTAKLQLIIELKNKLRAGLDRAKNQVNRAVGGIQSKLDAFGRSNVRLFDAIKGSVPGAASALGMISNPYVAGAAAAAAFIGVCAKATRMAAEWREKMAEINVTAEKTKDELRQLSNRLLEIGSRNANPLNEVPKAFSAIIGAIGDTDRSLATLEPTLRAAKAGFVDVETAASAGTRLMMAAGIEAGKAYDTIVAAVKEGNAGFADVANYLPKIVPVASGIGVQLGETSGAFAQLTKSLSPESAATSLQGIMRALSRADVAIGKFDKKTKRYVSGFKSIGVNAYDLQTGQMRPLLDIITDLNSAMDGLSDRKRMEKFDSLGLDQMGAVGFSALMQDVDGLKSAIDATTHSTGAMEKAFEDARSCVNYVINGDGNFAGIEQ